MAPEAHAPDGLSNVLRVLGRGAGLDQVAVDERPRERRLAREARAHQPEPAEDHPSQQAAVGPAADSLGHQAYDDVVGVRVLVAAARREDEPVVIDPADDRRGRDVAAGIVLELHPEAVRPRVVGHAAGVVEQLPQRHGRPRGRESGQQLANRVAQLELSARHQAQRYRAAERLGHARDPHVVGRAGLSARLDVGHSGAERRDARAAAQRHDRARRSAFGRHQGVELALKVGLRHAIRKRRWGQTGAGDGYQGGGQRRAA